MQRKATRQSRGPNATEKAHIAWIKQRGICAACGDDGGVIAHHMYGSTYKVTVGLERVQIGHAAVIGLCLACDNLVTHGSRKKLEQAYGPQEYIWAKQYEQSPVKFDQIIVEGILQCES